MTKPEDPTREGYQFEGWYYAERQEEQFDFTTKVTEDINLIAKWIEEKVSISELKINSEKNTIKVGEELALTLEIQPEDIDREKLEITWSSSDETIATVSEEGKVTAIKAGKVTITVTVNGISTSFELTIEEEQKEEETTTTASNSNKNTSTSTNKKPSTSTNTNNNANTNDNSNAGTEEPTPEPEPEPEPEPVTYTYEWVKADSSVAGQYTLYIVSSEGKRVAGTATLKMLSGKTTTVLIPASGKVYVKDSVTSVSNVKGN